MPRFLRWNVDGLFSTVSNMSLNGFSFRTPSDVGVSTLQLDGLGKRKPRFKMKQSGFSGVVQPLDMFIIFWVEFDYFGGIKHFGSNLAAYACQVIVIRS